MDLVIAALSGIVLTLVVVLGYVLRRLGASVSKPAQMPEGRSASESVSPPVSITFEEPPAPTETFDAHVGTVPDDSVTDVAERTRMERDAAAANDLWAVSSDID